jgi:hypothetical protein
MQIHFSTTWLIISSVTLKLRENILDKIFTVVFHNKVVNNAYNINFINNNKY